MSKTSACVQSEPLDYPIHEMLGVTETEAFSVIERTGTTTAVTMRVVLKNQNDAIFFIKTTQSKNCFRAGTNLGVREVKFYDLIDTLDFNPHPNIPKSLNRHVSEDGTRYFLVLEDCSASHVADQHVDFTALEPWRCAVRSLAHFHRLCMGRLSKSRVATLAGTEAEVEQYIEKLQNSYEQFKAYCSDWVDASIFSLLEKSIPDLRAIELEKHARIVENEVTTLTHGDAHTRNFLYPREHKGLAKVVDWQFWNVGIGTYDLRHLLGAARAGDIRQHQQELVQYYYQTLTDDVSCEYTWEACWMDYKRGILDNLFMPVWQYAGFGWDYGQWKDTLQYAVDNYYKLGCDRDEVYHS